MVHSPFDFESRRQRLEMKNAVTSGVILRENVQRHRSAATCDLDHVAHAQASVAAFSFLLSRSEAQQPGVVIRGAAGVVAQQLLLCLCHRSNSISSSGSIGSTEIGVATVATQRAQVEEISVGRGTGHDRCDRLSAVHVRRAAGAEIHLHHVIHRVPSFARTPIFAMLYKRLALPVALTPRVTLLVQRSAHLWAPHRVVLLAAAIVDAAAVPLRLRKGREPVRRKVRRSAVQAIPISVLAVAAAPVPAGSRVTLHRAMRCIRLVAVISLRDSTACSQCVCKAFVRERQTLLSNTAATRLRNHAQPRQR